MTMSKVNQALRVQVKEWMEERVNTCSEPLLLANSAAVRFKFYRQPKWLDETAEEVVREILHGKARERTVSPNT